MMKRIISFISVFLIITLLPFVVSCKKEPCLDLVLLESLRQEMETWYVTPGPVNQVIVDRNGIHQTLLRSEITHFTSDRSVEDDCGAHFGSHNFSIQYNTSVSPLHFMVDLRGYALDHGGFSIEISYRNTLLNASVSQKATYDFYKKAPRDAEAEVVIVPNSNFNGFDFGETMEITFKPIDSQHAIRKIWFAKQYGIIRFSNASGNVFTRLMP